MTPVKHLLLVALFAYLDFVANGILSFVMGYVAFVLVPLVGVLLLFRGPGRPWIGAGVLLGASAWVDSDPVRWVKAAELLLRCQAVALPSPIESVKTAWEGDARHLARHHTASPTSCSEQTARGVEVVHTVLRGRAQLMGSAGEVSSDDCRW